MREGTVWAPLCAITREPQLTFTLMWQSCPVKQPTGSAAGPPDEATNALEPKIETWERTAWRRRGVEHVAARVERLHGQVARL